MHSDILSSVEWKKDGVNSPTVICFTDEEAKNPKSSKYLVQRFTATRHRGKNSNAGSVVPKSTPLTGCPVK